MKYLLLVLAVLLVAFMTQPAEAQVIVERSVCPPQVYYYNYGYYPYNPYPYPYYVRPRFRLLPRAVIPPPVIFPRYVVPRTIIVPPPCPCR